MVQYLSDDSERDARLKKKLEVPDVILVEDSGDEAESFAKRPRISLTLEHRKSLKMDRRVVVDMSRSEFDKKKIREEIDRRRELERKREEKVKSRDEVKKDDSRKTKKSFEKTKEESRRDDAAAASARKKLEDERRKEVSKKEDLRKKEQQDRRYLQINKLNNLNKSNL